MKKWTTYFLATIAILTAVSCGKNENGAPAQAPVPANPWGPYPGGQYPGGLYPGQQYQGKRFAATLQISDRNIFTRFLSYARVCVDSGGFFYGHSRCRYYTERGYLLIHGTDTIQNNSYIQVTLGTGRDQPPGLEIPLSMRVYMANNNTSFVLQGGSSMSYPTGPFRIRADAASFNVAEIPVTLEYEGVPFASTVLYPW